MPTKQVIDIVEEEPPKEEALPEVHIRGDEAVIRVNTPQGTEERTVRLPKTTWG
jgi:hypothetical protein